MCIRDSSYSIEIWKRFRKWGGIPTGLTQNVKDLLASPEIENIFDKMCIRDRVYIIYTIEEIMEVLNWGRNKSVKVMKEIDTKILKEACIRTFDYRKTEFDIDKIISLMRMLKTDQAFLDRWNSY